MDIKDSAGSNQIISEGFLNQLAGSMLADIPEFIHAAARGIINIEKEASGIILDNLVKSVSSENTLYEVVKSASYADADKIIKRKKYQMKILFGSLDKEYKTISSGGSVEDLTSPYSELIISTVTQTGKTRDEAISWVKDALDSYSERLSALEPMRKGTAFFAGLTEYPYFYLIKNQNAARAKKFVLIDLSEYIFRLSFSDKYKNFIYYSPESFGKGFYSETVRTNKKIEIDPEYAEQSEILLKERFFPEVADVTHVYIKAPVKQWDIRDYQSFTYMISKSVSEGFDKNDTLSTEGNINDICAVMFPESQKFSLKHYNMAKERLRNLFGTQLIATDGNGKEIYRSVFDNAAIYDSSEKSEKEDGSEEPQKHGKNTAVYRAEFGKSITADILSNRLDAIVRPRFDELDTQISKMLYTQLKRDRTADLFIDHRMSHLYTQIALMLIIRLNDSRVSKRIERYSEALNEMKEKNILISNFRVVKGPDNKQAFEVEWIPFTDEEASDLRTYRKIDVIESKGKEI